MRKILIIAGVAVMAIAACKKDPDTVSTIQPVSRPTITLPGQFYSINTGGALPDITGTAYDSFLNESYPVEIVGTEALDNTRPGLYIINAKSTNKYGFYATQDVYVAVTDIPASTNISGKYKRVDVATGDISNVTRLARGLYQLDNLGGVARTAANASLIFPVLFVQSNDSTLLIPRQATPVGTIAVKDTLNRANRAILRHLPADTNYKYAITAPSTVFGPALRSFRKQ